MNPGSDPEIPSLKPLGGKEEEKKGGAGLPASSKPATPSGFKFPGFGGGATGGSKAFSAPNLKVRGLSGGGSTVMDRLKNLRKKDLIFIGAGLCTLGMAPLAEHLLMSPDEQSARLQEGFNSQQGPLFQDGSSVYEPGNGVGSPGGLVGQGADVITPLNVRDPSNLIMSPGASKKADAVVAPPPSVPAPSKGESDWKDVLRDSAKSGAGKAVQQSPKLPRPNVKMAGAIRGLSALGGGGGGTGASLKLDPLSARGVPNTAAGSNALTRSQATPGFRGATTRSNASSGAGEALRAAGSRQSDIFNRGGGAAAALDSASREAIPTGGAGSGGGRPGEGGETKNPGGNSQKDNKSLGESLAFLRQKMEMEKSIDLKWEKKKWNQFGRQKMMEESAIKLGFDMFGKFAEKAVIGPLGDMIGQSIANQGGPSGVQCFDKKTGTVAYTFKSMEAWGKCKNDPACQYSNAANYTCSPYGGGSADTGGTTKIPYEKEVAPKVTGAPQSNIAQQAGMAMDEAMKNCEGTQTQWSTDYCEKLKALQNAAKVQMKTSEDAVNAARSFIQTGYEKMTVTHGEMKKGVDGFSALLGPKGKADDTAPFALVRKAGDEAAKATTASGQEAKLKGAKDGGHKNAVGDAEPTCAAAAGTMKTPCAQDPATAAGVLSVVTPLDSADSQMVVADREAKNARTAVNKALEPLKPKDPAKPGLSFISESNNLATLGGQVDGALKNLEATVKDTGDYAKKARAIYEGTTGGSVKELQKAVFLGEGQDKPGLQQQVERTAAASKALVESAAKPCVVVGDQSCSWYHKDTLEAAPSTNKLGDTVAGTKNNEAAGLLSVNKKAFDGAHATAQDGAVAQVKAEVDLKKVLDTCSANFACSDGPKPAGVSP